MRRPGAGLPHHRVADVEAERGRYGEQGAVLRLHGLVGGIRELHRGGEHARAAHHEVYAQARRHREAGAGARGVREPEAHAREAEHHAAEGNVHRGFGQQQQGVRVVAVNVGVLVPDNARDLDVVGEEPADGGRDRGVLLPLFVLVRDFQPPVGNHSPHHHISDSACSH